MYIILLITLENHIPVNQLVRLAHQRSTYASRLGKLPLVHLHRNFSSTSRWLRNCGQLGGLGMSPWQELHTYLSVLITHLTHISHRQVEQDTAWYYTLPGFSTYLHRIVWLTNWRRLAQVTSCYWQLWINWLMQRIWTLFHSLPWFVHIGGRDWMLLTIQIYRLFCRASVIIEQKAHIGGAM